MKLTQRQAQKARTRTMRRMISKAVSTSCCPFCGSVIYHNRCRGCNFSISELSQQMQGEN